MQFVYDHFDELRESACLHDRNGEELPKHSPFSWFKLLNIPDLDLPGIEQQTELLNREQIFELVSDKKQDTRTLCAVILSWGGMHLGNGRRLFAGLADWQKTAQELRCGRFNRSDAYKQFQELRQHGRLPGMRPAYFTKLIFFLRGRSAEKSGYIMDQWTASSVNLLCGDASFIRMDASFKWSKSERISSAFHVSEFNDADRYEAFCEAVEAIAERLCLRPIDAEVLLMSKGRNRGRWRQYVIKHRVPPTANEASRDEGADI